MTRPAGTPAERMSICQACPGYLTWTRRCAVCGCFLDLKTRIRSQKCPRDKWLPLDEWSEPVDNEYFPDQEES